MMPGKPGMFKVGDKVGWREKYQPESFMGFAGPGPFKVLAVSKAEPQCRHSGVVQKMHVAARKCNDPYPVPHPQVVFVGNEETGKTCGMLSGNHLRKL